MTMTVTMLTSRANSTRGMCYHYHYAKYVAHTLRVTAQRCMFTGLSVRQKGVELVKIPASVKVNENVKEAVPDMDTIALLRYENPGAIPKRITIPKRLLAAAERVLKNYETNAILKDSVDLQKYIWSRQIPPEDEEIDKKAVEIEEKIIPKHKLDQLSGEQLEQEMKIVRNKVVNKLRKETYRWQALEMGPYQSLVYMTGFLIPNYSKFYQVMNEIRERDPEFSPTSLLDFGSGLATSVWAAHQIWPTIGEYFCWEKSAHISALARLLLQDGFEHRDMFLPDIFFRQQFEKRDIQKVGFDLVLSGHSLFELPDRMSRLSIIEKLWSQTSKYLILIENGTKNGHRLIEEARMHILEKFANEPMLSGHVFAPCPHDHPCPQIISEAKSPCNFECRYPHKYQSLLKEFSRGSKKIKLTTERSRFSYVVLKKGADIDEQQLRLLQDPHIHSKNCIQCKMCFPDGQIRIGTFSRNINRPVFTLAKRSKWGSRLPIESWEDCLSTEEPENSNVTSSDDIMNS